MADIITIGSLEVSCANCLIKIQKNIIFWRFGEYFCLILWILQFQRILVHGEIMKEIFLQIVSLHTSGDKLSMQLSDTINRCETIELNVQNLSKLSLYNVIKIEEYTLKLFGDSTKNNGQM